MPSPCREEASSSARVGHLGVLGDPIYLTAPTDPASARGRGPGRPGRTVRATVTLRALLHLHGPVAQCASAALHLRVTCAQRGERIGDRLRLLLRLLLLVSGAVGAEARGHLLVGQP